MGVGGGMNARFFPVSLGSLFLLATAAFGQGEPTFVPPRPETAARPPAAAQPAAQPRGASPAEPRRQTAAAPRAPATNSPCQHVTQGWADYRPLNDSPVAQGRATSGQIFVALDACASEQAAAPGDRRIAFLLARAFEVSGKGQRATPMFRQLSDGGFAPATTQLARAYATGSGVIVNPTTACDLYLKAAKGGDPWAFNPAANCLAFQNYARDPKLACRYFDKARASGTVQNTELTREDYCP